MTLRVKDMHEMTEARIYYVIYRFIYRSIFGDSIGGFASNKVYKNICLQMSVFLDTRTIT